MSFIRELKRRNVFRVGILYLASAWLLLQLTDVLSSLLSLPEFAGPLVFSLLALGFLPALIIAWAYEITPEGLKRESDVDRSQSAVPNTGRKVSALIVVLLVVAIGGFVADRLISETSHGTDVSTADFANTTFVTSKPNLLEDPSIAVLPFANISADSEQDYFAAGMTEDLITKLTHVRGMRVISLNSTLRYKDTDLESQQIGVELGVRHLLQGSVRKFGERVRITAQLIDSINAGVVVWAERWDRPVTDFFMLQDEIAANIINELEIELVEGEQRRVSQQTTDSPQAYEALRRGIVEIEHVSKSPNTILKAREWFESAIQLDPQYAAAYAWVALSYGEEVLHGFSANPDESLVQADLWAQRALALNDSLSRTYDTLGWLSVLRDDWELAYEYQRKALDLAPGNADASILIAETLCYLGREEEALAHVKRGMDLNPYPPWWYWWGLGQTYTFLGDYEQALAATEKSFDMYPDYELTRVNLIIQLMGLNKVTEARDQAKELLRINPRYTIASSGYLAEIENQELKGRFYSFLRQAGLE